VTTPVEIIDEDTGRGVPVAIGARPTLSPSALSAYSICGRRGQYYQDPNIPKGPPNLNMARGSAWHAALEWFNINRLNEGEDWARMLSAKASLTMNGVMFDTLEQITSLDEFVLDEGETITNTILHLSNMEDRWRRGSSDDRWLSEGVTLVDKEMHLFIPEFGLTHDFNGYADAVYKVDRVTGHVGVDYKATSKVWGGDKGAGNPRKLIQATLYAEAYERLTGYPMDWFAYDVMTVAGKFQRVWVSTSPEIRRPFLERWEEQTTTIMLHQNAGIDMPTNPDHILCSAKWCGFWDICPMGEALAQDLTTNYQQIGKAPTP